MTPLSPRPHSRDWSTLTLVLAILVTGIALALWLGVAHPEWLP